MDCPESLYILYTLGGSVSSSKRGVNLICILRRGGQFAPANTGQFQPAITDQFKSALYGQFDRFLQTYNPSVKNYREQLIGFSIWKNSEKGWEKSCHLITVCKNITIGEMTKDSKLLASGF